MVPCLNVSLGYAPWYCTITQRYRCASGFGQNVKNTIVLVSYSDNTDPCHISLFAKQKLLNSKKAFWVNWGSSRKLAERAADNITIQRTKNWNWKVLDKCIIKLHVMSFDIVYKFYFVWFTFVIRLSNFFLIKGHE